MGEAAYFLCRVHCNFAERQQNNEESKGIALMLAQALSVRPNRTKEVILNKKMRKKL